MDWQDSVNAKLDTLLTNQAVVITKVDAIESQAKKTNGRVTFLEKAFWTFIGGGALFVFIFHEKIIAILVGD